MTARWRRAWAGVKSPPIIACVIGISEKESPVRSSLG